MAQHKKHQPENEPIDAAEVVDKAKRFWDKNGKAILIALGVIALLVGGYFVYKNMLRDPKITESIDKSFKAEQYFKLDSFQLALNGDGVNPGFIKIADSYRGTPMGNLANFYAGVSYIKLNMNEKAVKHLEDFKSSSKPVQQRAYKLLGDAYGDLGKNDKALDNYKKAARHFEEDQMASADALFNAAYLAQNVLNKKDEAISLYKELKNKFPRTQQGFEADKYLAQLGVYKVN